MDQVSGKKYINASTTIATGGTAQSLLPADGNRSKLFIHNAAASGSLWVNDLGGTAAANTAGSTEIPAGDTFETDSVLAVSIVHATTSSPVTAGWY